MSYCSEQDQKTKSLADVWIYDIHLQRWQEIKPIVKVQQAFNNKKMRKTFEPRMAHSANLIGNYIVVFGGYCIQNGSFTHPNFTVLSLLGCTDYMLPTVCTIKHVLDRERTQVDAKLEQERKRIKEKAEKAEQAEKEKAGRASKKKDGGKSRDANGNNEAAYASLGGMTQISLGERRVAANGDEGSRLDSQIHIGGPTSFAKVAGRGKTHANQRADDDAQMCLPLPTPWEQTVSQSAQANKLKSGQRGLNGLRGIEVDVESQFQESQLTGKMNSSFSKSKSIPGSSQCIPLPSTSKQHRKSLQHLAEQQRDNSALEKGVQVT